MATATEVNVEEIARQAAVETADDAAAVGRLLSTNTSDAGVVVHFECELPGYRGWVWSVDLTVLDGVATVSESALLPGEQALLAPQWVPWSDRIRPGDLEPGMVLPYIADDPRVVPGYTATGDVDRDEMAIFEFGLGRARILAPEARDAVAERWYRGSHGPNAASAVAATAPCSTCAFFVPMTGSFRMLFGACSNEWSPSDGRVVSVDHGCGAHSETEAERRMSEWPAPDPLVDTDAVSDFDLNEADVVVDEPAPEVLEPTEAEAASADVAEEPAASADVTEEPTAPADDNGEERPAE